MPEASALALLDRRSVHDDPTMPQFQTHRRAQYSANSASPMRCRLCMHGLRKVCANRFSSLRNPLRMILILFKGRLQVPRINLLHVSEWPALEEQVGCSDVFLEAPVDKFGPFILRALNGLEKFAVHSRHGIQERMVCDCVDWWPHKRITSMFPFSGVHHRESPSGNARHRGVRLPQLTLRSCRWERAPPPLCSKPYQRNFINEWGKNTNHRGITTSSTEKRNHATDRIRALCASSRLRALFRPASELSMTMGVVRPACGCGKPHADTFTGDAPRPLEPSPKSRVSFVTAGFPSRRIMRCDTPPSLHRDCPQGALLPKWSAH